MPGTLVQIWAAPDSPPEVGPPPPGNRSRRRPPATGPAITILATLAAIYTLRWAQPVLAPVMLAIILSLLLSPAVHALRRAGIPRALGAAVLLAMLGVMAGAAGYAVSDQAGEVLDALPRSVANLRHVLNDNGSDSVDTIKRMQEAATQLESVATEAVPGTSPPVRGVTRVQVVEQRFRVQDWLWDGTLGVAGAVGQACVVLLLVYVLLVDSEDLRRKLVRLGGAGLKNQAAASHALDEIAVNIQRYLVVQAGASVLVGLVTWGAFLALGVRNAATWGVAAGVLNLVPYVGPVIVTIGSALVATLQFGSLETGAVVGGVALVITSLEGYLLNPWLTGRVGRLSPLVVLITLIAWGWLWGGWGLLLGVPVIMIVKAVCDRVEGCEPVGQLLGR